MDTVESTPEATETKATESNAPVAKITEDLILEKTGQKTLAGVVSLE